MKLLLFLLVFVAGHVLQVKARYRFEVRVLSYSNPRNQDWNGGCCEISCGNDCDVTFFFCLRGYNYSPSHRDDWNCPLGTRSSIGFPISTSSITFSVGPNIAGSLTNPVVFTGDSWPGSFQLLIRIDDDDSPDANDLVDRVILNYRLAINNSFSPNVTLSGYYRKITMGFSYRVICDTNYYGSNCNTLCVPQNSDVHGHYVCNSNGERVCRSGYTGVDCLTVICHPGCIQGSCSQPGLCDNCNPGWSGELCGECQLTVGCNADHAYCNEPDQCICNEGYNGTLCQIDLDVCGHQSPCMNGARCINNGQDYNCICASGYTGQNCERQIDFCATTPCQNGATCENMLGYFNCTCGMGWTGDTCDTNIDECSLGSPCLNGGRCSDCVPISVSVTSLSEDSTTNPSCLIGYMCSCSEGFFGDNCETDIDYCFSSPCENQGMCHDIVGGPGYSCTCPRGYNGTNCQDEVNECMENPCQNGATCNDLIGSFNCSCPSGFNGSLCETNINDCLSSTCNPATTHSCEDGVDSFTCNCILGYTGSDCNVEIHVCDTSPCVNGGTCVEHNNNDFQCECPAGFSGPTCGTNIYGCHPHLCLFGGNCTNEIDGFSCTCRSGRSGSQCEIDMDLCSTNPCGTGMTCQETVEGERFNCIQCVSGEAGCGMFSGINETHHGNDDTGGSSILGGVIGGVVAAFVLVALILVVGLFYCWIKCGGFCCLKDKEEETGERNEDHSQNNPLYFDVSAVWSSESKTSTLSKKPDHAYAGLSCNTQSHTDHTYTGLLQQGKSVTSPIIYQNHEKETGVYYNSEFDSHHYEHIPAQLNNGITNCVNTPDNFDHKTESQDGVLKSDKQDSLTKTGQEIMFLLPSPDELQKMANMQGDCNKRE